MARVARLITTNVIVSPKLKQLQPKIKPVNTNNVHLTIMLNGPVSSNQQSMHTVQRICSFTPLAKSPQFSLELHVVHALKPNCLWSSSRKFAISSIAAERDS